MAMQKGLEITYHNMQPTDWLDQDIRERVGKLEKMCDRLVGVRVAVEAQHKQHKVGNVYDVHLELFVPGDDLVVSRKPHKAKERYAHPDVRTSVRDAFEAAERQLKDYKEQLRGDVKVHESMFQGQVSQLYPDEDYGFILTNTGTQLYFHRNSLLGGAEFEKLSRGMAVHYIEDVGDTGPIATKVWIGPDHHMD
jgi:cold shock CspA family protein/ribosome-associated translation inhibitor RaiA